MSLGTIDNYQALAALQRRAGSGGAGLTRAQMGIQSGFDSQLRMAQTLFGEGSQVYGEGSSPGSLDSSLVNDSMMLEALAAISQLMRSEAGQVQRPVPSKPSKSESVQPLAAPHNANTATLVPTTPDPTGIPEVGALSARFESGGAGVGAIGYDRVGGTSYGKYQIASRPGTMDRFLNYLGEQAPAWADRLRNAGPANTGSKEGAMPETWREIAKENPARFEKIQHDFIASETYDPARAMILKQTGLDFNNAPQALREVLWSTSVQHGPTGASKIFNRVINQFLGTTDKSDFNANLIEGIYENRKGQFGSSTKRVQQAVANRFETEKQLALTMLGEKSINRIV